MVLTVERARELLIYENETGIVRWRITHGRRAVQGRQAGWLDKTTGYFRIEIDRERYRLHRVVWLLVNGEWPKAQIDHINLKKSDNRWTNLREATNRQNQGNVSLQKNNRSGFKGVSWCNRTGKWVASIRINRSKKFLGYFEDEEEAAATYLAKANQAFGEFARSD